MLAPRPSLKSEMREKEAIVWKILSSPTGEHRRLYKSFIMMLLLFLLQKILSNHGPLNFVIMTFIILNNLRAEIH